jgi:Ankyrin repeats (3 copies)
MGPAKGDTTMQGRVALRDHVSAITKGVLPLLCAFATVVVLNVETHAGPNEDILSAARAGDRTGVEATLTQGASVNAVDHEGLAPLGLPRSTTLALAAVYGHRNVAEFQLDRGANLAARDGLEQTPLHLAAEYGGTDVAKLLLDRGADWFA